MKCTRGVIMATVSLEMGNSNQGLIPSPLTSALQMKKVVQVACGSHHSLSLTDDGEVISFFMVIIKYFTVAGLHNHGRIS